MSKDQTPRRKQAWTDYLRLPLSTSVPELRTLLANGWELTAWDREYVLSRPVHDTAAAQAQ